MRIVCALLGSALALGGLFAPLLLLLWFGNGIPPLDLTALLVGTVTGVVGITAAGWGRYGTSAVMFLIAAFAELIWAATPPYLWLFTLAGGVCFLFAGIAMGIAKASKT